MTFRSTVQDCVRALARMGLDVSMVHVRKMPASSEAVGLYWQEDKRIEIRSDLVGCALTRVLLHEFGHALGLDHNKRGIMAPSQNTAADFSKRAPTARQIKMWTTEIARLVLRMREKQWHV